jgi:hypothetical protein
VLLRIGLVAALLVVALASPARADVFDDNPAAATLGSRVYVFARAADDRILGRHLESGAWSAWAPVDGLAAGSGPSALAFGSSLYLFARGQDGAVWWNILLPTGNWFGWRSLGGQVTSAPSAGFRFGTTTIDLAARGTNNELYHTTGSIDVFTRTSAGSVSQLYWQNGSWNGPFDLGGQIVGAPGSASAWLNRLDLYARGTDNFLYYHEHPNGSPKVWTRVGSRQISSSPAATSHAPGRELIFARVGGDLQFLDAAVPPSAMGNPQFGTWTSLGPIALADDPPSPPPPAPPVVVSPAPAAPVQPATPLLTLAPTISYGFSSGSRSTRLTALNVTAVPAGATVKATCATGCSAKAYTVTKKKAGTVSLKRFVKRPLKVGTKITVVTTKPGTIGSHKVLTIRARKRPSVTARCLPPGVTKPQAC